MTGALDGLTVVDLSTMVTGPLATMILGDQGADVVKVESPAGGDPMRHIGTTRGGIGALFANCNRNKRSVVVNLQTDAGQRIVQTMVERADVLVQNFRPGVAERLGLGSTDLLGANPRLVYVSLNAFGKRGPMAASRGYDHIVQALTGSLYVQDPEQPTYMRQAWVDKITAYTAAQGIVAALLARERTGVGQVVDCSMLDAGLAFMWPDGHMNHTIVEEEGQVSLPPLADSYVVMPTKDGWISLIAATEQQRTLFFIATGKPEVLTDPRFSTADALNRNFGEYRHEMRNACGELTSEDLLERLTQADVPCGPVLRPGDVPLHEQVVANGSLQELDHPYIGTIRQPRPAVRFEQTPSTIRLHAPALGEHTDAVMSEFGLDAERVDELRQGGVVG